MDRFGRAALGLAALAMSAGPAGAYVHSKTWGTFETIGTSPVMGWTTSPLGSISGGHVFSFDTGGAPNVLVSMFDTAGDSLIDVPAIFSITGDYSTPNKGINSYPLFHGQISIVYAGTTPLIVGSHTFDAGAILVEGFSGLPAEPFPGGFFGFVGSEVMPAHGFLGSIYYDVDPAVPVQIAPNGRPHIDAGSATVRGGFEISLSPEPDGWLLLIAGFGLSGAALRRRRTAMARR